MRSDARASTGPCRDRGASRNDRRPARRLEFGDGFRRIFDREDRTRVDRCVGAFAIGSRSPYGVPGFGCRSGDGLRPERKAEARDECGEDNRVFLVHLPIVRREAERQMKPMNHRFDSTRGALPRSDSILRHQPRLLMDSQ